MIDNTLSEVPEKGNNKFTTLGLILFVSLSITSLRYWFNFDDPPSEIARFSIPDGEIVFSYSKVINPNGHSPHLDITLITNGRTEIAFAGFIRKSISQVKILMKVTSDNSLYYFVDPSHPDTVIAIVSSDPVLIRPVNSSFAFKNKRERHDLKCLKKIKIDTGNYRLDFDENILP